MGFFDKRKNVPYFLIYQDKSTQLRNVYISNTVAFIQVSMFTNIISMKYEPFRAFKTSMTLISIKL